MRARQPPNSCSAARWPRDKRARMSTRAEGPELEPVRGWQSLRWPSIQLRAQHQAAPTYTGSLA